MNLSKPFLAPFLVSAIFAFHFGLSAAHAQTSSASLDIALSDDDDHELFVNNQNVGGCSTSVSEAHTFGNNIYIFAVGCDHHPHLYNYTQGTWRLITDQTSIYEINNVEQNTDGSLALSVRGMGNSIYSIPVNLDRDAAYTSNLYVTLGGRNHCELIINNENVGGCSSSITRAYQFKDDTYVFGIGADNQFPYYFSLNSHTWNLISNQMTLTAINSMFVDPKGFVSLLVTSTDQSNYTLTTSINLGDSNSAPGAGSLPNPDPQPYPYPVPTYPDNHNYPEPYPYPFPDPCPYPQPLPDTRPWPNYPGDGLPRHYPNPIPAPRPLPGPPPPRHYPDPRPMPRPLPPTQPPIIIVEPAPPRHFPDPLPAPKPIPPPMPQPEPAPPHRFPDPKPVPPSMPQPEQAPPHRYPDSKPLPMPEPSHPIPDGRNNRPSPAPLPGRPHGGSLAISQNMATD